MKRLSSCLPMNPVCELLLHKSVQYCNATQAFALKAPMMGAPTMGALVWGWSNFTGSGNGSQRAYRCCDRSSMQHSVQPAWRAIYQPVVMDALSHWTEAQISCRGRWLRSGWRTSGQSCRRWHSSAPHRNRPRTCPSAAPSPAARAPRSAAIRHPHAITSAVRQPVHAA